MTARTIGLLAASVGFALVLDGCATGVAGYDNYGADYYGAPYGGEFGAWQSGYFVGPYHDNRFRGGGGNPGFRHAWHGPAGRGGGVPFIPTGNRGGGFGGGHGR